jgi:hypothetical protein
MQSRFNTLLPCMLTASPLVRRTHPRVARECQRTLVPPLAPSPHATQRAPAGGPASAHAARTSTRQRHAVHPYRSPTRCARGSNSARTVRSRASVNDRSCRRSPHPQRTPTRGPPAKRSPPHARAHDGDTPYTHLAHPLGAPEARTRYAPSGRARVSTTARAAARPIRTPTPDAQAARQALAPARTSTRRRHAVHPSRSPTRCARGSNSVRIVARAAASFDAHAQRPTHGRRLAIIIVALAVRQQLFTLVAAAAVRAPTSVSLPWRRLCFTRAAFSWGANRLRRRRSPLLMLDDKHVPAAAAAAAAAVATAAAAAAAAAAAVPDLRVPRVVGHPVGLGRLVAQLLRLGNRLRDGGLRPPRTPRTLNHHAAPATTDELSEASYPPHRLLRRTSWLRAQPRGAALLFDTPSRRSSPRRVECSARSFSPL